MFLADLQDKYDQVHFVDKENKIYRSNVYFEAQSVASN